MKYLKISEVSEKTGLSASLLRIWEVRFGWPKPERENNGYRKYQEAIIEDLLFIKEEITRGKTIRDLIDDDGEVIKPLPPPPTARKLKSEIDFSSIPLPITDEAKRIREQLEYAIKINDIGTQTKIESEGYRLRPNERELAITKVLSLVKSY